jgi:hypothetical protein
MKTKQMLAAIALLFMTYCGKSQTQDTLKYAETVLIRLIESGSFGLTNNVDSKMIIVDNNNQTTIKPLKRVNYSFDSNEGIEENTQKLRQELQIWGNKGFHVKSMSSVAPRDFFTLTTIVLQKN